MKKTLLFVLGLLATNALWAGNNVICPDFHVGDSVVYETRGNVKSSLGTYSFLGLSSYVVAESKKDGCVIRTILQNHKVEYSELTKTGETINKTSPSFMDVLKGIPVEFSVDKYGKTKIRNMSVVTKEVKKRVDLFYENFLMEQENARKNKPNLPPFNATKKELVDQYMFALDKDLKELFFEQIYSPFLLVNKDATVGKEIEFSAPRSLKEKAKVTKYQPAVDNKGMEVDLFVAKELSEDDKLQKMLSSPSVRGTWNSLSNEEKKKRMTVMKEQAKKHLNVSSSEVFFTNGYLQNAKYKVAADEDLKRVSSDEEGTVSCVYHSWK